jgi:GntR family transcriptional regulator
MPAVEIDFSRFTLRQDVPPHRQVAAYLKALIALGQATAGDPVPAPSALGYRLKVGVAEVRKAYGELASRGYLVAQGGKWRVSDEYTAVDGEEAPGDICGRLWDLIVEARRAGLTRAELQRMFASLLERP